MSTRRREGKRISFGQKNFRNAQSDQSTHGAGPNTGRQTVHNKEPHHATRTPQHHCCPQPRPSPQPRRLWELRFRHGILVHLVDAELGETLNSAKDITVFAPSNDAFAALPKATLDAALKDPKGLLTKVLTNHVVPGKLTPDQLAGDHKTLGGGTITVSGSGESFKVGEANVICGNVQTANATVYIIDGVLLPK